MNTAEAVRWLRDAVAGAGAVTDEVFSIPAYGDFDAVAPDGTRLTITVEVKQ